MIKDPLMQWEGGVFPYDALAEAGITPQSNMKAIQDASYELIEKGLWTPERRAAWDELRTVERRLWIDLFLYPVLVEEIIEPIEDLCDKTESALPILDVSHLLRLDSSELQRMEQDFRDIEVIEVRLERINDFDEPLDIKVAGIEFDT